MILRPTVLILGAGASKPYGYPLGPQLVELIVSMTGPSGLVTSIAPDEPYLNVLHERLNRSQPPSIDGFLEANPDFLTLGKLCIAAALTLCGPNPDHKVKSGDWYQYLWHRLHEGAAKSEDFRKNQLRIITYNYESSFERYLTMVLTNYYPDLATTGPSAAAELVKHTIPVLHLHGTLRGADGIVQPESERKRFASREFLANAASDIQIVHEDTADAYREAHSWLQSAEVVHLMGFGYHTTNILRLDLVTQRSKSGGWNFGATVLGLEHAVLE